MVSVHNGTDSQHSDGFAKLATDPARSGGGPAAAGRAIQIPVIVVVLV